MAPVVGRQVDSVGLVVRGDDDAAAVEDAVLAQVLLVDAQHVRRGRGVDLQPVIELELVDVAEVAALVDAQHHGPGEAVEAAEHGGRRHFDEVPGADGAQPGALARPSR